jgi:hypothetical protein
VAQNAVSRQVLAASEEQRNLAFTRLLNGSSEKCDTVIKTQFNASVGQVDDWEARCRDGNSYSISLPADPNAQTRLLSCKELLSVSAILLKRAGSKDKPIGCQMK